MLALGEGFTTVLLLASLLLTAAQILTRKKPKVASLDDALQSTATQGAFLPLVIGRARVGPVFAFVEDTTAGLKALVTRSGTLQSSFAKGNGGTPSPANYSERALHLLCVGPASELRSIYQNGELVWNGFITPATHPSGTTIHLDNNEGSFTVYWGFADDPTVNGLALSAAHGIDTRYPLAMKVLWDSKNLGQSRQWPRLEYEVVCPCYSQIAQTPSEVPREGNVAKPLFGTDVSLDVVNNPPSPSFVEGDRVEMTCLLYNATRRTFIVVDVDASSNHKPGFSDLIRTGDVVRVWTNNTLETGDTDNYPGSSSGFGSPTSGLLQNGVWKYFYVVNAVFVSHPGLTFTSPLGGSFVFDLHDHLEVTLGSEVPDEFLTNKNNTPPKFATNTSSQSLQWGGGIARIQPVDSRNTDGINPIHLIDQLLFAKYPYGAGKDRSKFDTKSIEEAALLLQSEKIRAGVAILDGEGLESVLAPMLTDIAVQIPWDVEIGKRVFRPVREEIASVDLPADVILQQPSMGTPTGNRNADVLAFTFNDRNRNYREVPLRLMDSGQVAEYESQRSRKLSIEITQDRDSVVRLMPRLQQTAFANQAVLTLETNRATRLAMAGTRFKASTVEGPEFQFMVTSVQRDVNSPRNKLEALLDVYQMPSLLPGERAKSDLPNALVPSQAIFEPPQMAAFAAFEMPWALADGTADVEMLFLAARSSGATNSCVVWVSRNGDSFVPSGYAVIAARGVLTDGLPAGPSFDADGSYAFTCPTTQVFEDTMSLGADPESWAAGVQLMLVGSEVVFLQEASIDSITTQQNGHVSGLIRGRASSRQQAHAPGTEFWVLRLLSIDITKSPLLAIGANCEAKPQGVTLRGLSDVASAEALAFVPSGACFTPPPVVGLRLATFLNTYNPAADLVVRWNYAAKLFPRTGMGFQPLGMQIGVSPPTGEFVVQIRDNNDQLLVEDVVATNQKVLKVADRATYSLDTLPSWSIRVVHRIGSFSSSPVSLTLYP